MSGDSDMEYSSDNDCEYDDYYNIGKWVISMPPHDDAQKVG